MKKSQLKKILKPIVKECIKESLLEDGILSGVISEVFKGMGPTAQPIKAQSIRDDTLIESLQKETNQDRQQKLEEQKQKMLELNDISLRAKILVQFMESGTSIEDIRGLGSIIPGDPRLN